MPVSSRQLRRFHELDGKNFLMGIGAAKCATSWIYTYLQALPEIAATPLKELHFFSSGEPSRITGEMDLFAFKRLMFHIKQDGDVVENVRSRSAFQASVDRIKMIYDDNEYFAHFARLCRPETKTLCEITPAYSIIGQGGFERMNEFFASQEMSLKVMFIMRDPVDRFWSQLRFFEQNEPDRDVLHSWPELIEEPDIVQRADYRRTIGALESVFPREDILYLFYEEISCEASLKRLCEFVDVGYAPPDSSRVINETQLKTALPDVVRNRLLDVLAPQYAFCRQHFGNMVPDCWQA